MWEDEHCAQGGQWRIRNLPKTHTNKYWEDLCLALIGDMFTHENEVLGILINLKRSADQVQIWHKSGKDQAKIDTLKNDLEGILKTEEHEMKLEYEDFADTIAKYSQFKQEAHEGEQNERQHQRNNNEGFERGGAQRGRGSQRGGRGRGQW